MTPNRESLRARLVVLCASAAMLACPILLTPGGASAQDANGARHRLMEVPRLHLDAGAEHDLKLLEARLAPGPDLRVLEFVEVVQPEPPDSARIPPPLVHGFQDRAAMDEIVLVPFPPS